MEINDSTQNIIKYDAFISYKRTKQNVILANYLHRMLERYKIPKSFNKLGYLGKIGRVFKDTEELSTTTNLQKKICEKVRQSKTFILVCSNETHHSEWVKLEIKTFLETGRIDRIIVLLTEGDIHNDLLKLFKQYGVEVKPDYYSYKDDDNPEQYISKIEVIEINGNSEMESIIKLKSQRAKIIAKIIGCDQNIITNLDEHISRRKNFIIKLSMLVGAIVLMGSLFMLNTIEESKKDELIIQKRVSKKVLYEIANDININAWEVPEIENEIRNSFKADILDINKRNIKLEVSESSDSIKSDIATNYVLLSDLYLLSGNLDAATELYQNAVDNLKIMNKSFIEYGELIDATSDYITLGDLQCRQKKYEDAIKSYEKVLVLNKRYKKCRKESKIASFSYKVKDILVFFGICQYVNSSRMKDLVLKQNDALIYQKIGDAYYDTQKYPNAINAYYESCNILDSISISETEESRLAKINLYNKIGNSNYLEWNIKTAIDWYVCSMQMLDQLLSEYKGSRMVALNKMMTHKFMGDAISVTGDSENALKQYIAAHEVCKKFGILDAVETDFKMYNDTTLIYNELANRYLMAKDIKKSLEYYKEFMVMEKEKYDKLNNSYYKTIDKEQKELYLSDIKSSMSLCNLMLNKPEIAITDAKDAISSNPNNDNAIANLAFALCIQGQTTELKGIFEEVETWTDSRAEKFYTYCTYTLRNLQSLNVSINKLKSIKILLP